MSNNMTVENLDDALQVKMSAADQYQLHAHVLDHRGLNSPAGKMRGERAEKTGHSDLFMERILLLKGAPDLAFAISPKCGEARADVFRVDLANDEAVELEIRAARLACEANDVGSHMFFEKIAIDEACRKAWSALQLEPTERIGEQACSAKMVSVRQDEAASASRRSQVR